MSVQVECYSGGRYAERPKVLILEGERMEIAAVLKQWRLPEGPCFRVITQEEMKFDLFYFEAEDEWHVERL